MISACEKIHGVTNAHIKFFNSPAETLLFLQTFLTTNFTGFIIVKTLKAFRCMNFCILKIQNYT